MAIGTLPTTAARARLPWRTRVREILDRERVLGPLFITPALILIMLLVAYPFCVAVYFSLSNSFIGRPSHFIALTNFIRLWAAAAFRQTFQNAFVFTGISVASKLVLDA